MNANPNPNDWAPPSDHTHDDHLLQALPAELPQSPIREPQQLPSVYEGVDLAAVAAAPPLATPKPPAPAAPVLPLADHKVRILDATRLPADGPYRDVALVAALRSVSAELEAAEEDHARATKRLELTRELFDWASGAISGYSKTKKPEGAKELARKRRKKKNVWDEGDNDDVVEEINYEERFVPPNEGALIPPIAATPGSSRMTEEQIVAHRDAFYRKLCGIPHAELSSFSPPANSVNLKSRAQLDECVFIVEHWDTGTEDVDMMDFRRQHKTFYTKMKVSKENIGRRTGHHLRDLAGIEGRKAFCRYGKNDESLMYVPLEELYDAIFEVHCLTGHRAWLATKKITNMKYANIPQGHIMCFVETCPVCSSKKTTGPKRQKTEPEEEEVKV